MGVFARRKKLWIRFRDLDGRWRNAPTGYSLGEEKKANEVLAEVEDRLETQREATTVIEGEAGAISLRKYAHRWLAKRATSSVDDDRSRIKNHILPALGDIALAEIRPKHVRDFVKALGEKRTMGQLRKDGSQVGGGKPLAPRTIHHVYAALRLMLTDAVADELIRSNPCTLKRGELPKKKDKDPAWRRGAVFTREEVQTVLSAPARMIPPDRRTLYAIMFLGAMRFGEATALTWGDYDATCAPLGKLVVEHTCA